jgi:Fungal chitosanase of glycosyl hydrolase group 75
MRRKLRLVIIVAGLAVASIATVPAIAATTAAKPAAAGPSASQLLARVAKGCTKVSKGNYKSDDETSANISICKAGSAFVWKADMDIDCDGISTSNCNKSKDPWYQGQTSFQTSKGKSFQADKTHYYVIPLPSSKWSYKSAGIKPGAVAAVIYNNKVVYAVFADEGPSGIIGEASYATAKALGINPDPSNGGVDSGVTYVVFPGQVPSPVEDNSKIDAKGVAAATAFINS